MPHAARLTIDLSAVVANWRLLGARAPGAEAAGVVKADAYGCGLEPVVRALKGAGCRTFFVAHLSEGRRARAVVPNATIYVLNGLPAGASAAYAQEHLRPVLGSLEEITEWRAAGGAEAALHVDTGLNRLGMPVEDIARLPPGFRPSLLLSHFVASEVPDDPANVGQAALFAQARAALPGVPASLENSSGLFLKAEPPIHFDMVRPGYSLYGGNPAPGRPNPMRPVVRLDAEILQLRTVRAGETVGYNGVWRAREPRRIATVSLGYADGFLRSGSAGSGEERGAALVGDALCPVVGRVSMDLITLDVTDVPLACRGAPATFIGDALDIDSVGARLGTNGYEVLTRLSSRLERLYVGGP